MFPNVMQVRYDEPRRSATASVPEIWVAGLLRNFLAPVDDAAVETLSDVPLYHEIPLHDGTSIFVPVEHKDAPTD